MEELDHALQESSPEKIIFTTFTTAGANEAKERALKKFPQYREDQFRYFRTLHSLGYRNIPRRRLLGYGDYISLGREVGYPINAARAFNATDGNESAQMTKGDHLLHLDALKRNRYISFDEVATLQELSTFSSKEIEDFSKAYAKYREQAGKYDFTDQLEHFLAGIDRWTPEITHLFVDEAQDLTPLQWEIIHTLGRRATKTVVAGDDKQAIYKFSGGDPRSLIQLDGERRVLGTSYRLPAGILEFAESVAGRINELQRYEIVASRKGGQVHRINDIKKLDLTTGSWLFLCRNRKFLPYFEQQLAQSGLLFESMSPESDFKFETIRLIKVWGEMLQGYPVPVADMQNIYTNLLRGKGSVKHGFKKVLYALDEHESLTKQQLTEEYGLVTTQPWSEAFVLPELLKNQLIQLEKEDQLNHDPRIRVATIHAVKGQEADNVVVLPDLSYLTDKEFRKDPDNEHRVFYVGVTRARQNLYLHQPLTDKHYKL